MTRLEKQEEQLSADARKYEIRCVVCGGGNVEVASPDGRVWVHCDDCDYTTLEVTL